MSAKITIADLFESKRKKRKIVAVSCYDYTTATLISQTDIDMILVGDSAAQLVLGFDSTLPATMDFMLAITAAVRRGARRVYLVADMPFLSYHLGFHEAIKNAGRFITQTGAQMVKLETGIEYLDVVKAVSDTGIAVMAHIGIRPQNIGKTGRLKAEGTTAKLAAELITLADKMVLAGASCLLLEGIAAQAAHIITQRVAVPVISCGSGLGCDGQILLAPDILGLLEGTCPKFAKSYADSATIVVNAFNEYSRDVRTSRFPDDEHCYHMRKGEFTDLEELLKKE